MEKRLRSAILALALVLAVQVGASAQLYWWGEYAAQGNLSAQGGQTDWLLNNDLNAHLVAPLFDYRLGSLAVDAGIYAAAGAQGGQSGTAAGLGSWQVTLNLFPYRRFPLSVYYGKSERKGLFDQTDWASTRKGARLLLKTGYLGPIWLQYEDSTTDQRGVDLRRQTWRIDQNRRVGPVTEVFSWDAETREMVSGETLDDQVGRCTVQWRMGMEGLLQSDSFFQSMTYGPLSSRAYSENLLFDRHLTGPWRLLALAGYRSSVLDESTSRGYGGSAALHYEPARWRLFGGAAYDTSRTETASVSTDTQTLTNLFTGATWFAGGGWQFTGDAAVGNLQWSSDRWTRDAGGPIQTFHAGVSRNSDLPEWASRLAFHFKEISFERRLYEAYPPGYAPAELLYLRQDYYERSRSGRSSFSADLYHSRSYTGQVVDELKAIGRLQFNSTLALATHADWTRASGGLQDADAKSLYADLRFHAHRGYTAGLFAGYTQRQSQSGAPGGASSTLTSSMWGGSFSMTVWKVPLSAYLMRVTSEAGESYDQLFASGQFTWRDMSFRLIYQYYRYESGAYSHRLQIDLLRLFRGNAY